MEAFIQSNKKPSGGISMGSPNTFGTATSPIPEENPVWLGLHCLAAMAVQPLLSDASVSHKHICEPGLAVTRGLPISWQQG